MEPNVRFKVQVDIEPMSGASGDEFERKHRLIEAIKEAKKAESPTWLDDAKRAFVGRPVIVSVTFKLRK